MISTLYVFCYMCEVRRGRIKVLPEALFHTIISTTLFPIACRASLVIKSPSMAIIIGSCTSYPSLIHGKKGWKIAIICTRTHLQPRSMMITFNVPDDKYFMLHNI
jgi:hypothetical protein